MHHSHRIAGQRPLDLAAGRGADVGHAQGAARYRPDRHGMARLPSVGVHDRRQEIWSPSGEDWGATTLADAAKVRLRDVLRQPETEIDYTYDFGDNWELRLIATDIRQGQPDGSYPHYVGGERNGPPEDCGGIYGFYDKLDALRDPKHPDHTEISKWLSDYDPAHVDTFRVGYALGRIANGRNAGRVAWAKGRVSLNFIASIVGDLHIAKRLVIITPSTC
jgi:hypothetical protein